MERGKRSTGPISEFSSAIAAGDSGGTTTICKDISILPISVTTGFLYNVGVANPIPDDCETKSFCSDLFSGLLKVDTIQRGRIVCHLSVKPAICNAYGGLHGGAIKVVAEMVSIACARTVVGQDKDIFLGELSTSYLSAAPQNVELVIDSSVVRQGRNLTVIAVEFRIKETKKLTFISRATFYNMPLASL